LNSSRDDEFGKSEIRFCVGIVARRGEEIIEFDSLDEPFNFEVKKSKFDRNELFLIGGLIDSDLFESLSD
jgi:hypothetical protein